MNTTYVLLIIIIIIQVIILLLVLKPYLKTGFDRMNDVKLYNEIVKVIQKEDRVSTSFIQRKFGLGYSRSAMIMDLLEEKGIVSAPNGSEPRKVIKTN